MDVQRLSALKVWSVWIWQPLGWGLCVAHALMASLEMERSAQVSRCTYIAIRDVARIGRHVVLNQCVCAMFLS